VADKSDLHAGAIALCKQIESDLVSRYGFVIGGEALCQVLGMTSLEALRKAALRKTLPIATFQIEHRRGQFALARDLARWMVSARFGLTNE